MISSAKPAPITSILGAAIFSNLLAGAVFAQFSFCLIDNFESGKVEKWYRFGNVKMEIVSNPSAEVKDVIAESCGEFSLRLEGTAENWYVGGIGRELNIDAAAFSRLQMDVYGCAAGGKIKVEVFDDDNRNYSLEQDPERDWLATRDDKWVAEVPVLGDGFTRISIPFTAFKLENPGSGDGKWNPEQKDGSGGILKMQMILLTGDKEGSAEARIDNLIMTY
jgi:hypothetical protein